jgi:magnesium transporter
MSESEFEAPPVDRDVADAEAPAAAETRHDEDDRLKSAFVSEVVEKLHAGDVDGVRALVEPMHAADIADLFELVGRDDRSPLAEALAGLIDGDVLAEMNDWVRDELIEQLSATQVAEIAGELDTDDAVAIIEDMEEADQRAVLRALDPDDRAAIEEALSYPEESAGRLMRRDAVAVPEHWTIGQVIDFLRAGEDITTDFWEVFVVDPAHRPVGTCLLSWILRTPRRIAIADVMKREQTLIPVDMDQEEVALRFQKYALISAAVVDQAGRLVGMITADDVVHIIQEEASEDILRLSGAGEDDINEPLPQTVRRRLTWLIVNLGTAVIAAGVVGLFQGTISHLVALAVLMPIVSGMGGNAGTQTMAVAVRALALNQLTSSNSIRVFVREFRIALVNGACLGVLLGIAVSLIFRSPDLGIVIALAMVINNLVAGIFGVLVPVTLEKLRVDPAVSWPSS